MRVAIYSRVSTDQQDAQNQNLALTEWAKQRGFEVTAIYQEQESAWRSGHQHQLAKLIRDARLRRFDTVLTWSLDRLTREGPLAILTLVHRLGQYGVRVLSHQESWTECPGELGELLLALSGWVARMESQRRSERTKSGLVRAAKEGRFPGRPHGSKDKRRRKKRSPKMPAWADMGFYSEIGA